MNRPRGFQARRFRHWPAGTLWAAGYFAAAVLWLMPRCACGEPSVRSLERPSASATTRQSGRSETPVADHGPQQPPVFIAPEERPPSVVTPEPAPPAGSAAVDDCEEPQCGPQCGSRVFPRLRPLEWLRRPWIPQPDPGWLQARESWLQRPYSATWFLGMVQGSALISDWVTEQRGVFGGLRFGKDFDRYYGAEMRFAFGSAELHDSPRAVAAQLAIPGQIQSHQNNPFDDRRNVEMFVWDVDLLLYPWGDRLWRPYLFAGLGTTHLDFSDRIGRVYSPTMLGMPFGAGLKYHCADWLALRVECADNVAFGNGGVNTLHQVSIVGGAEIRLGGSRKQYWPWTPGRNFW